MYDKTRNHHIIIHSESLDNIYQGKGNILLVNII